MHPPGNAARAPRGRHNQRLRQPGRVATGHVSPLVRSGPLRKGCTRPIPREIAQRYPLCPRLDIRRAVSSGERSAPGRPSRHGQWIRRGAGQRGREVGAHYVQADVPHGAGDIPGVSVAAHRPAGNAGRAKINVASWVIAKLRFHAVGCESFGIEGELVRVLEFIGGHRRRGVCDGEFGEWMLGQFGTGSGEEDGLMYLTN
mmetsp:Transcript_32014/g.77421  ORF Transcript_32014/g.77421 Transcript_32014/m.77421 type:complete len:201 (-) Transcript_32014:205-807(-)